MNSKLIIFDLDGVLVDSLAMHYESLNKALEEIDPKYAIPWNEHIKIYNGLKTTQKLEILSSKTGLPTSVHQQVWQRKQEITQIMMEDLKRDERIVSICKQLKTDGHLLACCSNCIRRSVYIMLAKIGAAEYMDLILSNEDVVNSKPHPEMYWKTMATLKRLPNETLIVEDSPPGLLAAHTSGAVVLRVANPDDVSYDKIANKLNQLRRTTIPKWQGGNMNIVVPMAGAGSRFSKAGYTFPKPLIEVAGMPMIQRVVANININAKYIFIVQKEHREKYNLDMMFKLFVNNFEVVETEGVTEGAACTVLLAKRFIDNDEPMMTVNADQLLEWNSNDFMYKIQERKTDGCIITFTSTHPMWSFAKVDENGVVTEVAEKNPISDIATAGLYYWSKGSDFVKYAERMIERNIRVNNEFYVCPVYNQAIEDGKIINIYPIEKMWNLGTPEDLNYYLIHNENI